MKRIEPPVIAVYGGAFDPPHLGHCATVMKLISCTDIKSVVILPSFAPPHKTPEASFGDRVTMCVGALRVASNVFVDTVEGKLKTTTYTVDVMTHLPGYGEAPYVLVLGTDEVRALPKWKSPAELFANVGMLVVNRPGSAITEAEREIGIPMAPVARKRLLEAPTMEIGSMPISSSAIRQMIRKGNQKWEDSVPSNVARYIKAHGLYGYERRD
jgi:nicotinate-nucleotide adenylyltransferase